MSPSPARCFDLHSARFVSLLLPGQVRLCEMQIRASKARQTANDKRSSSCGCESRTTTTLRRRRRRLFRCSKLIRVQGGCRARRRRCAARKKSDCLFVFFAVILIEMQTFPSPSQAFCSARGEKGDLRWPLWPLYLAEVGHQEKRPLR